MSLRRGEKKDLISLRDPPPPETSPGGVRKDGEGGKTFGSVEGEKRGERAREGQEAKGRRQIVGRRGKQRIGLGKGVFFSTFLVLKLTFFLKCVASLKALVTFHNKNLGRSGRREKGTKFEVAHFVYTLQT